MPKFKEVEIELDDLDLQKGVAIRINLGGIDVWLIKNDHSIDVYYDECAHMGGSLKFISSRFICQTHGWTYDKHGRNINSLSPGLRKLKKIFENENRLVVSIPDIEKKVQNKESACEFEIKVLSHACIQLSHNNLDTLFDPWLVGNAYYGSWQLYPDAQVDIGKLSPSSIVITHPHPDHFHLETLEKFERNIPIFFPKFPSRIIESTLQKSGFLNINPSNWGDSIEINQGVWLEFLKPRSFWEDSATLIIIKENNESKFNWLNLVDAGSVIDEFALPEIDLLTSAFDQGASGYPLTWSHLSWDRKEKLMASMKSNHRRMLTERARKIRPRFFLPFAGHWRLSQPEHQRYSALIPHTKFEEIISDFKESSPEVVILDVYPGESVKFPYLEVNTNSIIRSIVDRGYISKVPTNEHQLINEEVKAELFRTQMRKLVSKSEVFGVENVHFTVSEINGKFDETFYFSSSASRDHTTTKIKVKLPTHILNLFAEGEANFDHIAIGYWGEWDREPDLYPSNFMRLLQTGVLAEFNETIEINELEFQKTLSASISDYIELNPEEVSRILTRAGLPCASCIKSNTESLRDALNIHQIDLNQVDWLLRELVAISKEKDDQDS
jgi:CMP-N-acetylneuraminate monooxygenase